MRRIRWVIADWLSFAACKLRGNEWYRAGNWAGVKGNRAAELSQSVFERCVALETLSPSKDPAWLKKIEAEIGELGIMAGENWGHQP